jgi:hypothetical protein
MARLPAAHGLDRPRQRSYVKDASSRRTRRDCFRPDSCRTRRTDRAISSQQIHSGTEPRRPRRRLERQHRAPPARRPSEGRVDLARVRIGRQRRDQRTDPADGRPVSPRRCRLDRGQSRQATHRSAELSRAAGSAPSGRCADGSRASRAHASGHPAAARSATVSIPVRSPRATAVGTPRSYRPRVLVDLDPYLVSSMVRNPRRAQVADPRDVGLGQHAGDRRHRPSGHENVG